MVAVGQIRAPLALGRRRKWQIGEKNPVTNRWEAGQEPRSATCRVTRRVTRRMRTYTWC